MLQKHAKVCKNFANVQCRVAADQVTSHTVA